MLLQKAFIYVLPGQDILVKTDSKLGRSPCFRVIDYS
jgi:hypothetical protein